MKELANTQKKLADENERIRREKGDLENRMLETQVRHNLTTPSSPASMTTQGDEVEALIKRINEQMIIIEDLNLRIGDNEADKHTLKQTIANLRADVDLKENLIAQLTQQKQTESE